MNLPNFHITNQWILLNRGKKNQVDPFRPYAYLVEKELTHNGKIEDVTTIFLTNKECPFRCLMCDLWKNTTDQSVPTGAIAKQIEFALEQLPSTKHLKLYNSGNFFDSKAIPAQDHDLIIQLTKTFDSLLIENHPKLTDRRVLEFRDRLKTDLLVALGLETVHPEVLPLLNKQMTLYDFETATSLLNDHDILSRAFILLKPPFLDEREGIEWAKRSIDYAFDVGVECCVLIPTRAGNGAMDHLQNAGHFESPSLKSLEQVMDYGVALGKGRVFADLWDVKQFSVCGACFGERYERLENMNFTQKMYPTVSCSFCLS